DGAKLFETVERRAPALLRVSRAIGRIPGAGPILRRFVPVANYEGQLPLTPQQLEEWAILDTYDWLAPRFDQPQTAETLRTWFVDSGLADVEVFKSDHLT